MVVLFLSSLNLPFSFIHSSPLSAVAALYTWTVKFCHVADICFHGNGIFSPWKPCFMSFSTECFYIKERTILFWLEGTAHVHHGDTDHFARSCSSRSFHGNDVLFKMFISDHIHQKKANKKTGSVFCLDLYQPLMQQPSVCVTSTACLKQVAQKDKKKSVFSVLPAQDCNHALLSCTLWNSITGM